MNQNVQQPTYELWTRLPVAYLPVTLGDQLVGYLWGSKEGKAASFFPHLAVDINRVKSSIFWHERLDETYQLGLTPLEAIRYWAGKPEDPRYGGIRGDAEEKDARTIQELALLLNPGTPLGDGPWVQDATYPSGAPEDRTKGLGPLVSVPTRTYPDDTAAAVTYLPITRQETVVGYLWASLGDDNAASYLARAAVGRTGTVAGGLWRSRLIDAFEAGLTAIEALQRIQALPANAPEYFGVIDPDAAEQRAASLSDLRRLAEHS